MKRSLPIIAILALFVGVVAFTVAGCTQQPEVTSQTAEEADKAAEEEFLEPGEEPGELIEPGVNAEEMTEDQPPTPEEEAQEEPQGPTEPGVESDELDPIETGPPQGGMDVEEIPDDTPPHAEERE